jgi:predicted GH43/DUF377 family glycosyl hydrolase
MVPLEVKRLPSRLEPDTRRTITRFFWCGAERAAKITQRVLSLSEEQSEPLLQEIMRDFLDRHLDLEDILLEHFEELRRRTGRRLSATPTQKLLLGAYCTMEYAFESAALFNPSMVPTPPEEDTPWGETCFLMSLRAVGEGHVSSIVFRRGKITAGGDIRIQPVGPITRRLETTQNWNPHKDIFRRKLQEMGTDRETVETVMNVLGEEFTTDQLRAAIALARPRVANRALFDRHAGDMIWLANSNYEIRHEPNGSDMEQIVLFPTSEAESMGMEDMRLVCFQEDDGSIRYYGTYTAYNGRKILPQLLEIVSEGRAFVSTLHGNVTHNKGMALFPRRLQGQYAMIGRIDGENLFYMRSDDVHIWDRAECILEPRQPWEFVQIGNCGSPLETEAGWLLLTHGVGPMRKYCLGALLLDRDDPRKLLGQLEHPLMMPTAEERSGYVPNVVYSCGAMIHGSRLIIPYGISDVATGFATVELAALLDRLQ